MGRVRVVEINAERRDVLREEFGAEIQLLPSLTPEAVAGADVVCLCVKPQVAQQALGHLRLQPSQVAFSIMAGVSLEALSALLGGHKAVVRCMPNTPAQVFRSVSVYTWLPKALSAVQEGHIEFIVHCLGGYALRVPNESYVDKAVGVTGSGPAYVFLLLEAFVDTAVELGFARAQAVPMVLELFQGSVELVKASPAKHLVELRNQVTSPGGTTAQGLAALEAGGIRETIRRGILASYEKSIALQSKL